MTRESYIIAEIGVNHDGQLGMLRALELGGSEFREVRDSEELEIRDLVRKNVIATRAIRRGESVDDENAGLLRPGTGIAPRVWERVLGARATCDISEGKPIC